MRQQKIKRLMCYVKNVLSVFAGMFLLAVSMPRRFTYLIWQWNADFWKMAFVNIQSDEPRRVILNIPFSNIRYNLSPITVFLAYIVSILSAVILSRAARGAIKQMAGNAKHLLVFIISTLILLLTLIPVKARFDGLLISLHLILASMGMLLVYLGIQPMIPYTDHRTHVMKARVSFIGKIESLFLRIQARYICLMVFIYSFAMMNLFSYFVFEHIPHIQDSIGQVFHGKIFATGKLKAQSHIYREFFDFTHMISGKDPMRIAPAKEPNPHDVTFVPADGEEDHPIFSPWKGGEVKERFRIKWFNPSSDFHGDEPKEGKILIKHTTMIPTSCVVEFNKNTASNYKTRRIIGDGTIVTMGWALPTWVDPLPPENYRPLVEKLSTGILEYLAGSSKVYAGEAEHRIQSIGFLVNGGMGEQAEAAYSWARREYGDRIRVVSPTDPNLESFQVLWWHEGDRTDIPRVFLDSLGNIRSYLQTGGSLFLSGVASHYVVDLGIEGSNGWYSQYPPGHSFLLMFGLIAHVPWMINPLLGSLTILLLYFVGREIYDERTGRLAMLLGLFSPFILFMSSEFMSHTSSLLFISLFILFFAKAIKGRGLINSLIAGACLGYAINVRPLTTISIAVPFLAYGLVLFIREFRKYLPVAICILVPALALVSVLITFNYLTNGDPFVSGYEVLHGKGHGPGFGHSGWGPPHTPKRGLIQIGNSLNALNKYLFEWPIPSTLFVFFLLISMTRNRWDFLLLGSFIALLLAYFSYWHQGWCFGPRYLYESSSALILLTARGILRTPVILKGVFKLSMSEKRIKATLFVSLIVLILYALTVNMPPLVSYYSDSYWMVNADVIHAVKESKIANALIFVKDLPQNLSYYGSVFAENSPKLDGDIIYARDLGERNALLMNYYPFRKYYIADGANLQEITKY